MKVILNKIRKVLIGIGISLISFGTKVFGENYKWENEILNPNSQFLYGVVPTTSVDESSTGDKFNLLTLCIIPLVLIIGLIYWIKSKNDKKKKVIFIGIVAAVGILCCTILGVVRVFLLK